MNGRRNRFSFETLFLRNLKLFLNGEHVHSDKIQAASGVHNKSKSSALVFHSSSTGSQFPSGAAVRAKHCR